MPYKAKNWYASSHEQCFSKNCFSDIFRCAFEANLASDKSEVSLKFHSSKRENFLCNTLTRR